MLLFFLKLVIVIYSGGGTQGPSRDWALGELGKVHFWIPLARHSVFYPMDAAKRTALIEERLAPFKHLSANHCPVGMAFVKGSMQDPEENRLRQNKNCLDGGNWKPGILCQHFDQSVLSRDVQKHQKMEFCIDLFEFPNIPDEFPATMVSWQDADSICKAQDKRLCTEDEWTFSCEGEAGFPYPHGYNRYVEMDAQFPGRIPHGEGCNQDHLKLVMPDMTLVLKDPFSLKALLEIDKGWRGMKSMQAAKCKSSFGVYDLTGNIEEWTVQSPGRPVNAHKEKSVLKGGYWAPVQARCQMAELAHGPSHRYYQTGFRCCKNAD